MLPEELSRYKPLYLQTAWEYIRTFETNLHLLSVDATNEEALQTLHISAHSLKGQSLMMHFEQLGAVCFALERLFKSVRDGKRTLSEVELQKILMVVQDIKASMAEIAAHDDEKNLSSSKKTVEAMIGGS